MERMEVLPLALHIDCIDAEIRAPLERKGRPPGGNDCLIAAHALAHECALVTDNTKEFRRIPRLRVENRVRPNA